MAGETNSTSLSSLYKDRLRGLHPCLPLVRERLVKKGLLTRTEANRGALSSQQFSLLCNQLASKGTEKKENIMAVIEAFKKQSQVDREEDEEEEDEDEDMELHHKLMLNGREKDERRGRGRDKNHSCGEVQAFEKTSHINGRKMRSIQMDPFLVKIYCFIYQLIQTYQRSTGKTRSHDTSHDLCLPEWFLIDLDADQVLSYFPSRTRDSLGCHGHPRCPGSGQQKLDEGFEIIRLSEFLGAFKSYVRRNETEVKERKKTLMGKTKLLQSLTERNAQLEDQLLSMTTLQVTDLHQPSKAIHHPCHHNIQNGHSHPPHSDTKDREEIVVELKKQVKRMELREKELTAINEQWAIDAEERASEVAIFQIQLQDAKSEIQRLSRRDKTDREHDTSQKIKQMEREIKRLKGELEEERRGREEDKDEIEELRDRTANLKVQAQTKMPTVTEVVALSSENRQLREEVERGRSQIESLLSQLKRLEEQYPITAISHESRTKDTPTTNGHVMNTHAAINLGAESLLKAISTSPTTSMTTPPELSTSKKLFPAANAQNCASSTIPLEPSILPPPPPFSSSPPPSPPPPPHSVRLPPNQPEAIITSRPSLKRKEKKCPKCETIFLTLGEREFQSHVAWCHLSPL